VEPDLHDTIPVAPPSRRRRVVLGAIAGIVVAGLVLAAWPPGRGGPMPSAAAAGRGGDDQVTILADTPASIDPAKHGDLGSAAYVSQLYETLTAVDPSLEIQPALAERWSITDDGSEVTFTLRPDLTFSDGTPLTAADVVRSWRRLFIPGDPSPLASLIADVRGAAHGSKRGHRLARRAC
jgi:peptide/nickel transport system substrate-binding protein